MKDEPERYDPKDDDRAREAAENPLGAASTHETGKEKMVRNRFFAPAAIAAIAVILLLIFIIF